jgi:hypothetical protein
VLSSDAKGESQSLKKKIFLPSFRASSTNSLRLLFVSLSPRCRKSARLQSGLRADWLKPRGNASLTLLLFLIKKYRKVRKTHTHFRFGQPDTSARGQENKIKRLI